MIHAFSTIALIEMIHPGWWVLAVLIPLLWWWGRSSLDPLSPARRLGSVALRTGMVLLLAFALTDPRLERSTEENAFLWLVDVSDSLGDQGWDAYQELPEAWRGLSGRHSLLLFAGEAEWHGDGVGPEHFFRDPLRPDRTDLAHALRVAEAFRDPGRRSHLILLSDGRALEADWERVFQRLKERELPVHTVLVEPPDDPEVLVLSLHAPDRVRQREPFSLRAEVFSNREQDARLRLYRGGALVHEEQSRLRAGMNVFVVDQVIEQENLAAFTFWVDAEKDTFLDNNERMVYVHADGPARILMLSDAPQHSRYLALALRQEGIQLDVRPAVGAPQDMGDLQNYDALILDNVPATDLSSEQLRMFRSYVQDFGGGLLMLGGDQSFGLGGYHGTPLHDILPLHSDYTDEEESPSVALALVLDKSGSMSGERIEMARAAAIGATELLKTSDYAGVVVFDGEAQWVAEMELMTNPSRIRQLIESIQAGGGTNLAPGMQLALDGLRATPAQIKHAIVLSDGHSVPGPFGEIAGRMGREGITVSTVGVGQGVDVELLREVARLGQGRYYYTASNEAIPQIMAQETMTASGAALQELPFAPVVVRSADFLAGLNLETAPFLYGHVKTSPRETAELWLATEEGYPLFASWRYGLGRVGAFTSDARNRWGLEWLRWAGYSRFWAQTIRHLQRPESSARFPLEVDSTVDGFRVRADTVHPEGAFWNDLEGRVLVLREDGRRSELTTLPMGPGRHEFMVPKLDNRPVHLNLRFRSRETGEETAAQYLTLVPSYPDEYLRRPADPEFLARLSRETGGTVLSAHQDLPTAIGGDQRRAIREVELWPWLVALAFLLFFLDLANKRLPTRRPGPGLRAGRPFLRQTSSNF